MAVSVVPPPGNEDFEQEITERTERDECGADTLNCFNLPIFAVFRVPSVVSVVVTRPPGNCTPLFPLRFPVQSFFVERRWRRQPDRSPSRSPKSAIGSSVLVLEFPALMAQALRRRGEP